MMPNWMLNHNFECFWPTYWMFWWLMFLSPFEPMEIWQMLFDIMFCNGWCYCHYVFCGIWHHILYCVCGRCYNHFINWLMLLPWWQMELPHIYGLMFFALCNRWNSHLWQLMYYFVADGMTTFVTGWCYCHGGRWNWPLLECVNVSPCWQML